VGIVALKIPRVARNVRSFIDRASCKSDIFPRTTGIERGLVSRA
jgi:hypothetical protein